MKTFLNILVFALCVLNFGCGKSRNGGSGGGQDIGGGNVVETGLAGPADLREFLQVLENKRVETFRTLEVASLVAYRITNLDPEVLKSLPADELNKLKFQAQLYQLIFANKNKLADVVSRAKIDVQDTDNCYKGEEPVDGSIFGPADRPICISVFRLSKKLKEEDYQIQLLALYVHEVSHLFGTNEEQATHLQKQILEIGPNFRNYLSFLFEPPTRIVDAIKKMKLHAQIIKETSSHSAVCRNLYGIFDESYKLFVRENGQKVTISYLRTEDIIRTHAILVASVFAKDYCESDWSGGKIARLAKWKGKTEVEIKEIYPDPLTLIAFETPEKTLILSQYLLADISRIRIKSVKEGDHMAMLFNLDVIVENLEQIQLPF